MMLRTLALLPPSWLAMLPQKFSAATTCTAPDDDAWALLEGVLPQPASSPRSATSATSDTTDGRVRRTRGWFPFEVRVVGSSGGREVADPMRGSGQGPLDRMCLDPYHNFGIESRSG